VPPPLTGRPCSRGASPKEARTFPENHDNNNEAGKNAKSKKPGDASLAGILPVTYGKNLQNHRIPPFGYPCFHHTKPMDENPGCFPEKNGPLFPVQEPPEFFGHNVIPGHSSVPHDQLILPIFTLKETRLNWPVFSRLKRSVSKNT
jgi:hypothetical protein